MEQELLRSSPYTGNAATIPPPDGFAPRLHFRLTLLDMIQAPSSSWCYAMEVRSDLLELVIAWVRDAISVQPCSSFRLECP